MVMYCPGSNGVGSPSNLTQNVARSSVWSTRRIRRALYCSLLVSMTRVSSAGVHSSSVIPGGMVAASAATLVSRGVAATCQMQPMEDAVQEGRDDHPRDDEVEHSREERIDPREDLGRVRRQRVNRPHSTEDHRCIEEGID